MGATLVGMTVLPFAAPEPLHTIIGVKLPGSPRCYTYASEAAVGRLPLEISMITRALKAAGRADCSR